MSGHKAKLNEQQVLRVFEHQKDVTTVELANYLGCDLSAAHWWRRTLTERNAIEEAGTRPSAKGGRASMAFRLKPQGPRERVTVAKLGDRVITPSNRVAVVVDAEPDGRLDVQYADTIGQQLERGTTTVIAPALLAVWRKNQPRPEPVRVR